MIKEILIALVAVVVVILIIAFAALRFLRADDSDTFDDLPDEPRKPVRALADSGPMPAPVERHRPMRPEPARDQQVRQPARSPERASAERGSVSYRDRDAQQRPASSGRRAPGAGQRLAVTAARGSRPARQTEPDTQVAASWEAMSDVDYWTELAADKPLTGAQTGPVPTSPPPSARRRGPDAKPDRQADSRAASRDDQPAPLPVRQRAHPRGPESATQSIAALARLGAPPPATAQPTPTGPRPALRPDQPRTGPRPAIPRAPQAPPASPISYPGAQGRLPLPLDDDPLTSPSFPAINAADSRSYRTRRPGSPHASPPQAGGRDRTSSGFSQPGQISQISQRAQQYAAPALPDRSASAPNGYPVQAPAAAPAANPYGSFVGPPQAGHPDAATGHLGGPAYGNGYGASGQPAGPDPGWYANANANGNGNGYHDPGYHATGHHAGPATSAAGTSEPGYAGDSYAGADYYGSYGDNSYNLGYPPALPASGYAGGASHGSLPDPASYQPNGQFAGHYDQRAIAAPDPAYGNDGYQGYTGYGGSGR
jgi:hypothetical protein